MAFSGENSPPLSVPNASLRLVTKIPVGGIPYLKFRNTKMRGAIDVKLSDIPIGSIFGSTISIVLTNDGTAAAAVVTFEQVDEGSTQISVAETPHVSALEPDDSPE